MTNNALCHSYGGLVNYFIPLKMSIFNLCISRWSRCAATQHIISHCYFFDMAKDEQRHATTLLSRFTWLFQLQLWTDFKILLLTCKALPWHSSALSPLSETPFLKRYQNIKMMSCCLVIFSVQLPVIYCGRHTVVSNIYILSF